MQLPKWKGRDAALPRPYERRRYAVLANLVSGKVAVVDTFDVRLSLMKRRVHGWAEVVRALGRSQPLRLVMVGLTIRPGETYSPGMIRAYLKSTKQRLGAGLVAWAWVAEVQARGAMHYHVIFAFKPGTRFPKPDGPGGSWPWGSSKVQTARSPFYLVTYAGKEHQKDLSRFPKSCRLYGVSVRPAAHREALRILTGLAERANRPRSSWAFVGASVGQEYAEEVLTLDAARMCDNRRVCAV